MIVIIDQSPSIGFPTAVSPATSARLSSRLESLRPHGRRIRAVRGLSLTPKWFAVGTLLAAAIGGCGNGTPSPAQTSVAIPSATPTQTAAPTALPTATPPTPTPRPPIPDAHSLTFQAHDIPAGYAPHPTAILTIDSRTVVSEEILSTAAPLAAAGYVSGAEYGWEARGTGQLAAQNFVIVVRDTAAAAGLLAAVASTARSHGASSRSLSIAVGEQAQAYALGHLVEVQWRRGPIVAAVEVTDGSLDHAAQLAQMLDRRFAMYG